MKRSKLAADQVVLFHNSHFGFDSKGQLVMSKRPTKAIKAFAVFLAFAVAQISIQIGFAEPAASTIATAVPQNIIVARLATTNNQPITVNGASAASGATILNGAEIETPAAVGATINLGALGSVDLAPNTKIKLTFDENGNLKVTLISGCAIIRANKNTEGEMEAGGTSNKTDKSEGGILDVCFPPGAAAPTVGQGAAASAGAGAGGSAAAATAAGAAAGGGGIGTAATVAIIGGIAGVAIGVPLAVRGQNPSPTQ